MKRYAKSYTYRASTSTRRLRLITINKQRKDISCHLPAAKTEIAMSDNYSTAYRPSFVAADWLTAALVLLSRR